MAQIEISAQTTLFTSGQALNKLYLLIKGSVKMNCHFFSYTLEKGDVIGIIESGADSHFCTCTALEDSVLLVLPYSHKKGIVPMIQGNQNLTNLFSISLFRQISYFFDSYHQMLSEYKRYQKYWQDTYNFYSEFCKEHSLASIRIDYGEQLEPIVFSTPVEHWEISYYKGLHEIFSKQVPDILGSKPDVLNGFTQKAFFDIRRLLSCYSQITEADQMLAMLYLNEDKKDLFECLAQLTLHIPETDAAYGELLAVSKKLNSTISNYPAVNHTLHRVRVDELSAQKDSVKENGLGVSAISLQNSASVILDYADCTDAQHDSFLQALKNFKNLTDKTSSEDDARKVRLAMTKQFNAIYSKAILKAVQYPEDIPLPVKMLFQFGFVDEELAGSANTRYLASLIEHLPTDPSVGVYSMFQWFHAIYTGKKEPCRNEFDQDFPTYLREQRITGEITSTQEQEYLKDQLEKVRFELTSVFPSINKITFGRITTFCPVFCDDFILKPLQTCLLTKDRLQEAVNTLRSVDYSAFYRETVYSNPEAGINQEFIQVEYLPDFILTPNVGGRPVMWQEIEGKKRTTPARMMLSTFFIEDLKLQFAHLVGEFRWEICRRVQGGRWNDVSEPSLTSEYFDYVQFYRKNHELSTETKEKIKTSLQKARNSYKELFIQDYMTWVIMESNGAPRLNKISRGILFTYCPFSKEYRDKLRVSPQYSDLFKRYDIKKEQKLHRFENLLSKSKFPDGIPDELQKQKEFLLR